MPDLDCREKSVLSCARVGRFAAGVFTLTVAVFGSASAQDADPTQAQKLKRMTQAVEGLTSSARKGKCPNPPRTILLINGSQVCNPDSNKTKECDEQYSAPSKAWQACYGVVRSCHDKIDALNTGIVDYNKFVRQRCPPPKGTFTKMMPLPVVAAVPVNNNSSSSGPGTSATGGVGSASSGFGGARSSSAASTSVAPACSDDSQTCMSACLNDRGRDSIISCNKDCTADSPGGKFCLPAQNVEKGGSSDSR